MTRIREPGDGPKCACGRPAVWNGYCSMSDGIGSCNMTGRRDEPDVYYLDGKPQPVERHPPRTRQVPITFPPLDPLSEEGLYARVRKLEGELDAVRGTRPALRLFPGETIVGEPRPLKEGFRYSGESQEAYDLRVFHLTTELGAVSREATEHAEARAGLLAELHAVRVLDAWAKKNEEATPPTPIFHRYMSPVPGRGMMGCWLVVLPNLTRHSAATAAEARAAAAKALLEEDPTLGTEA